MEIVAFLFVGVAFVAGVSVGSHMTRYPAENEMFRRLVRLRTERKVEANVEGTLDAEIESHAERLAR